MPSKQNLVTVLAVLMMLAFTPIVVVGTAPQPPASYYGNVLIDGESAPAGIEITAYIDGSERGSLTTSGDGTVGGAGTFDEKLDVRGSASDQGKTVVFEIGHAEADTTVTWSSGDHRELSFTIGLAIVGNAKNPPSDPDGDELHEDLNGNGRLDFDDLVSLFDNLDSAAITAHPAAFDFNGNGRIDFDDIVTLFEEI